MSAFWWIIVIAWVVFVVVSMWKVFEKAGQPGWGAIIPIYNVYLLLMIAGRPAWWLILMLVPVVNIVVELIVSIDIAKNFGKGTGFGLGLFFLGAIFFPILAFGDAVYEPVEA
ncbi:MAG: signal peptidase I [Gaiellales bacterium]|nr:MAG: signal peptidase I [Gaiellales bacterium]